MELRDIDVTPERNFEATLQIAVDTYFSRIDDAWLNDPNTRFLFILDGFDELVFKRGTDYGLKDFLKQVGSFQTRCKENKEKGHRMLVTGRDMALFGLRGDLPSNLERVGITLMDEDTQNAWIDNYEKVMGKEAALELRQFLDNQCCPAEVKELAKEPLLLYLLAKMRRDDYLRDDTFENIDDVAAGKIQIYEETLDWVLTKLRPENLTKDLTDRTLDDLRSVLEEAGLCVVQSRQERTTLRAIRERLKRKGDERAASVEDSVFKDELSTFYIKSAFDEKTKDENSVEFTHKSFGEFLFAKRLWESLDEWSQDGMGRKTYAKQDDEMHKEIYDLLGYACLSPEIVEYVSALLRKKSLNEVNLFKRLKSFYFRWSDGYFIDDCFGTTLPQEKARELGGRYWQRAVDILTGLNVLILLLELHRYAQTEEHLKEEINFHPCGDEEINNNERRLLSPK